MRVIIGLGNPGAEYAGTRHNAGMQFVELLASSSWRKFCGIYINESPNLVLVKTANYFMNESSNIIRDLQRTRFNPVRLYVVHDDLDIKLGEYKIQKGKGPKVHYGMQSVEQALGTKDFWRVRIGIDNRTTPIDGETYVLQKFTSEEKVILEKTLDAITKAINTNQESGRQK